MDNMLFTTVTIQLEDRRLLPLAVHATPYEPSMILTEDGILGWREFPSSNVQDLINRLSNAGIGKFVRAWD
jgi:hypothetical protein